MTTTSLRRAAVVALALGAGALLAGCGSSGPSGAPATTKAASPAAGAGTIAVSGAWARTSATGATTGAAYLTLENTGTADDALVKAAAPTAVAARTEIHETVAADAGGSGTTMAMGGPTTAMGMASGTTAMGGGMGAMTMRPVDKVAIPAKGKAELKPGGYHIMLLDLAGPLTKGTSFDLTLTFASGATKVVKVDVRDQA